MLVTEPPFAMFEVTLQLRYYIDVYISMEKSDQAQY